jgi:hypothetical protein
VQAGDLVAASDIDFFISDDQTEGLVEAGGESAPGEVFEFLVDAGDDPDVAVECADGSAAVGEEVEAGGTNPGVPGILLGDGESIDGVGEFVVTEGAAGGQRMVARWAAFGECSEIGIWYPLYGKWCEGNRFYGVILKGDFAVDDGGQLEDLGVANSV